MDQRRRRRKPEFMNNMMDEIFHPCEPICRIIPTSTQQKQNQFVAFRPEPKTCLDYNISQTETKMDAGDTKIHYQETVAQYVPDLSKRAGPRPPKKHKYFDGGPPHWVFVDEIWRDHQLELQKDYHRNFKIRVARRKKLERLHMSNEHRRVIVRVGPTWYQELSPKQIATVDNLKNCMLKDLSEGTIINTQENIGYLGLVLRPNYHHIKKALNNCCKCPVEFLLVLYQLINPIRKRYSLNDRLLLSAVVHLTMMETLKELHIRIPSPPPPPKTTKKSQKKKKRVKYDSPYLEHYDFKRQPKKYTNVLYTNTHVQRPQSPYFCYLKEFQEMKKGIAKTTKSVTNNSIAGSSIRQINVADTDDIDDQIEKELCLAQEMYQQLVDFTPVPALLKPSRYIPCDNFRNKPPPPPPEPEETEEEDMFQDVTSCYVLDDPCDTETEFSEGPSGTCDCPPQSTCPCASPKSKCNHEEVEKSCCSEPPEEKCFYAEPEERKSCQSETERLKGGQDSDCFPNKQNENEESCKCGQSTTQVPVPKKSTGSCQSKSRQNTCTEESPQASVCVKEETRQKSLCGLSEPNSKTCRFENKPTKSLSGLQSPKRLSLNEGLAKSSSGLQSPKRQSLNEEMQSNADFSPICVIRASPEDLKSEEIIKPKPCKHAEGLAVYDKMIHLVRPTVGKENIPCTCKETYEKFVKQPWCQCEKCQEDRKNKTSIFVIAGLKESGTRIIDRVIKEKPCVCLEEYSKKVDEYLKKLEDDAKRPCDCRKETKKWIETPFCQCARCKEDRRRKAAKFVIRGIKATESEKIRIIDGISMGKPCDCVKCWEKRVDKYEEFKKRQLAPVHMKEQDQKYVIGGVTNTPEGPVYVILGMRPPIDCTCAKQQREEAAEQHMKAIMPHVPPGRVKYGIVGVKETPAGNVFVLEQAIAMEDCECMDLYKTFTDQHSTCLQLYEDYLVKMKEEYNAFMNEMLPPSGSRRSSNVSGLAKSSTHDEDEDVHVQEEIERKSQKSASGGTTPERRRSTAASEASEKKSKTSQKTPVPCESCVCGIKSRHVCCNCGNPYYSVCCNCGQVQTIECAECICGGQVIECVDCTCGVDEEEVVEEEETKLKRFFIFKKISCNLKWQRRVIREALQSMADDDFPLAKLPHAYKLPHFKLWMQMRCGKFWTQEEKYRYVFKSKDFWRHIQTCTVWSTHFPKLAVSKSDAKLLTWFKAPYVRKLVNDGLRNFYSHIKQNRVHFGREFIPTTFTYEFPSKTWRDCYFAYTPGKEEDVLARFVWQKYDFKHVADMQRFCG